MSQKFECSKCSGELKYDGNIMITPWICEKCEYLYSTSHILLNDFKKRDREKTLKILKAE